MSAKKQAYLPQESSTNLASGSTYEAPQKVVISGTYFPELKSLEEIKPWDEVMSPHTNSKKRSPKFLERVVSTYRLFSDYPLLFLLPASLLTSLSLGLGISSLHSDANGAIAIIAAVGLPIGVSLFFVGEILDKIYKRVKNRYGFIRFPEVEIAELSKSNLTHEQIYEIASLGEERDEIDGERESISTRLADLGEQMKSSRVLNDITQLEARWELLSEERNKITERISAIITNGS